MKIKNLLLILAPLFLFSKILWGQKYYTSNYIVPYNFDSTLFDEKFNHLQLPAHPYNDFASKIRRLDKRDFKKIVELVMEDLVVLWVRSRYNNSLIPENYDIGFYFRCPDEVEFEFIVGDDKRTIASAHSPLEGNIKFIINIDKWEELNNFQRVWLFTHELGHEFFGLKHGTTKLMYPIMPEEELNIDFRLLYNQAKKTTPRDELWQVIEKLDEFAMYKHWKRENRYSSLNFGRGFDEDKMGFLSQRGISPAFATLWSAIDEMFDMVFSDLIQQAELDIDEEKGLNVSNVTLNRKFNYTIDQYIIGEVKYYNILCK